MKLLSLAAMSVAAIVAANFGRKLAKRRATRGPVTTTQWSDRWAGCDMAEWFEEPEASRITKYVAIVEEQADRFDVDPDLVLGTIHIESGFNPEAKSDVGATGLMQLMPSTSKSLAEKLGIANNPRDPTLNVMMGTSMISTLLERWDGNEKTAMASYFAGEKNVRDALAGEGLTFKQNRYALAVANARDRFAHARRICAERPAGYA
jgi:soluble lytic murein transglycosylase-like protein